MLKRALCLLSCLVAGCSALTERNAAGTFSVHFSWAEGAPANFTGWAQMRVEYRPDGPTVSGQTLGTSGPDPFEPGLAMHFDAIPNKSNLVLIVELRDTESSSGRVLYYGLSEPFTLSAGKNTEVGVSLALVATPAAALTGDGNSTSSVLAVLTPNGSGIVSNPNVQLQVLSSSGQHVSVANVLGFPSDGTQTYTLSALQTTRSAPTGYTAYVLPWNLYAGVTGAACAQARGCAQTVYAQVVDAYGYPSDTATASVTLDTQSPGLLPGASLASPSYANAASVVVVSLVSNEPLQAPPAVSVQGVTSDFDLITQEGNTTYSLVSHGAAAQLWMDGTYEVLADLTDLAGNTNVAVHVGSFKVDSTLPDLVSGATVLSATSIRNGQTLDIAFQVTEATLTQPAVFVGDTALTTCQAASTANAYTCTYSPAPGTAEGYQAVTVQLVDLANNMATRTAGTVNFDTTDPSLAFNLIAPTDAAANTQVLVSLTFSEPLQSVPILTAQPAVPGPQSLTYVPSSSTTTYDFEYTTPTLGGDGNYVLTVTATDLAGNVASDVAVGSLQIDGTPPVISNPALVTPSVANTVNANDVAASRPVSVQFHVNVPLQLGYPQVRIGTFTVPCTGVANGGGDDYTCTYNATTDSDGDKVVTILAVDVAGNSSSNVSLTVHYDLTPPTGVLTLSPAVAGAGRNLTVHYAASKPLAATPTLTVTLPGGGAGTSLFGTAALTGLSYDWNYTLQPSDPNGTWQFAISGVQDTAGNGGAPATGSISVDQTAPTVLSSPPVSVTPARAKDSTRVTATFTASKPLAANPTVYLGTTAMTLVSATGNAYTYSHNVAAAEGDGTRGVVATFVDAAGNYASATLGTVTYDFIAPGVSSASVTYTPSATNPLAAPTMATVGTVLTVEVIADETLSSSAASAVAVLGGTTLPLSTVSQRSSGATFSVTLPSGYTDGVYTPYITWTDLAGNTNTLATFTTPAVTINTSVPNTGSINTTLVKHLRLPNGSRQNGYVQGSYLVPATLNPNTAPTSSSIPGVAFQQASEALAQVRLYTAQTGGVLLGTSGLSGGNWLPVTFLSNDASAVWASVVDPAGNESPRVRVKQTEWVATTTGLVAGDTTANPHQFESRPIGWDVLEQPTYSLLSDANGIGAAGDGSMFTTYAGPYWRRHFPAPLTYPSNLAADTRRGRTVFCGGATASDQNCTALYAWQYDSWNVVGVNDPESDGNPYNPTILIYDVARDVMVGISRDDAVWEYDGTSWRNMYIAAPATDAGYAYNPNTRRVVAFGGTVGGVEVNNLWEYDGSGWTQLSWTGSAPTTRSGVSLVYDTNRDRLVVIGGYHAAGNCDGTGAYRCTSTWEWNNQSWTQTAVANPPQGCTYRGAAFDAKRGKTVVYGGVYAGGSPGAFCDVYAWEYDGNAWTVMPPADPEGDGSPSTAYTISMAYDPVDQRVLMISSANNNLWSWDGMSWQVRSSPINPNVPNQADDAAQAEDPVRHGVFYFGGDAGSGTDCSVSGGLCSELWSWNNQQWTLLDTYDVTGRTGAGLAWDALHNTLWMFGGVDDNRDSLNDTWGWTEDNHWTQASPATSPPGRQDMAMVYDPNRRVVVMVGGTSASSATPLADFLWEWDGTNWQQRCDGVPASDTCPVMPAARASAALAFDAAHGVVLITSGYRNTASTYCATAAQPTYYPCNDTWTWDGNTWRNLTPSDPNARAIGAYSTGMAYDPALGQVVFIDNATATPWMWDGTRWTSHPAQNPFGVGVPLLETEGVPTYFASSGALTLADATEVDELDDGTTHQPAHVFRVNMAALNLPAGDTASYTGLLAQWWAGGVGTAQTPRISANLQDFNSRTTAAVTFNATLAPELSRFNGLPADTNFTVSITGTTATWTNACLSGTNVPGAPLCATPNLSLSSAWWRNVSFDLGGSAGSLLSGISQALTLSSAGAWANIHADLSTPVTPGATSNGCALRMYNSYGWQNLTTTTAGVASPQLMAWQTSDPNAIAGAVIADSYMYFGSTPLLAGGSNAGVSTDAVEVRLNYTITP